MKFVLKKMEGRQTNKRKKNQAKVIGEKKKN